MMSSEPYKNEYQTSIMASRIVKDLVKQKLPKGETFDPGCWKAYNHLSPQEQLSAANQLRNSNLESAVNPSAYFLKMINKARYSTPKAGSSATAPTSKGTRPVKVHDKQGNKSKSNGATDSRTTPSLWAEPEAVKVKITKEKIRRTGKELLAILVHGELMSAPLDKDCLSYFEQLTERQQLTAANLLKRKLTSSTRNPSALLTSIVADVQSSSNSNRPTITTAPQRSPSMPATSEGSLNMQRFVIEALFLDNLSPECRRAYERLPPEAQYRMKQRCAEDKTVRYNSKAFLDAIYSITGQGRPQPAYIEGMNGIGDDELIPAKWSDTSDEGQDIQDAPQTELQAWPQESQPRKSWSSEPQAQSEEAGHIKSHHHTELQAWPQDAPEIQPRRSWSSESQAPSQGEGQSTSKAVDLGQNKFCDMHNEAMPLPNGISQPWEDPPLEGVHEDSSSQQGGHDTTGAAEAAGVPATAEAIDTAAQELMGLLIL